MAPFRNLPRPRSDPNLVTAVVLFCGSWMECTVVKEHIRQVQINSQIYNNNWPIPVFLKLGSAKGCQGFREKKMRNDGTKFVGRN
jgi:hypothetical protein